MRRQSVSPRERKIETTSASECISESLLALEEYPSHSFSHLRSLMHVGPNRVGLTWSKALLYDDTTIDMVRSAPLPRQHNRHGSKRFSTTTARTTQSKAPLYDDSTTNTI
ncbi:hypothetical protein GW17_00048376 [Ensete ventricosum]|nr:hypothetical protein GW17_00048376 [Ensete ventricosum]